MTKAAELAKWGEVSTNGQVSGRRNIVINGAMNVAQRSASVTGIGAASGYFTLDRFKYGSGGTTAGRLTMTQTADGPSGFANCLKLDCTTADTSIAAAEQGKIEYRIEGQDVQQLKKGTSDAEKLTVSFYVKGNAAATYECHLLDVDNSRQNRQTFNVTTDWNRISLTFVEDTTGAFDDNNARSLDLRIWLHAGSNFNGGTTNTANTWVSNATTANYVDSSSTSFFDSTDRTFFITGVQLEVGSVATPFEHRSFGEELQLCRRYLQYFDAHSNYDRFAIGTATTTDDCNFLFKFNPYMRDVPTLVHGTLSEIVVLDNDNSAEAIGSLSIDTNTDGPQGCNVEASDITSDVMTAGDATQMSANNTANAFISFDSEL